MNIYELNSIVNSLVRILFDSMGPFSIAGFYGLEPLRRHCGTGTANPAWQAEFQPLLNCHPVLCPASNL